MTLRDYQIEAVEASLSALQKYNSALLVMSTGTGKTQVFAEVRNRWPSGRAMVLAHREELVFQGAKRIQGITGKPCGIEMAKGNSNGEDTIVASVQSLRNGRLTRFDPTEFGLLIVDEAHHAVCASYRKIMNHFNQAALLGVTATPNRTDNLALGQFFNTVSFQYDLLDGIDGGYLVPIEQEQVKVGGLDISKVRSRKRDLHLRDLSKVMELKEVLKGIAYPTLEIAGTEPTLIFTATVLQAHMIAKLLNNHKAKTAIALDGGTEKNERRDRLEEFSKGGFQYLLGCNLFLEGFDCPHISIVAMARPTKSELLYRQAIGRGTRTLPGLADAFAHAWERRQAIAQSAKDRLLVIDFCGNPGRHKLISTRDVLGGLHSYGTVKRRRRKRRLSDYNYAELVQDLTDELKRVWFQLKRSRPFPVLTQTWRRFTNLFK